MGKELFREKSLQKIESPESLNDYIRVSKPGVWLLVAAVILLLIGACVWGLLGHVDTVVPARVAVTDGIAVCELADAPTDALALKIGDETCEIVDVSASEDGTAYVITAKTTLPDGAYDAKITTESIKPFSLVFQ